MSIHERVCRILEDKMRELGKELTLQTSKYQLVKKQLRAWDYGASLTKLHLMAKEWRERNNAELRV